jgi:hypothetical protein
LFFFLWKDNFPLSLSPPASIGNSI